ncbi:MAG TPA: OPT/YSL family transporter [Candidatus Thermoplasmatota archaeon]|jgi:uncharacterized oligopeptide transporter (OPT) family protein|nr:OPT/YSL family transporter [Candidatus Thermoplasmatota archaeon]
MARAAALQRLPRPPAAPRVEPFSAAMWARLNTGTLEQQLEAQARASPGLAVGRGKLAVGLAVGLLFAVVNQYVGLRTGLIVFGSWYVVFMAGLARGWRAAEINMAAIAASGASFIVGGFAYVYPALFLLAAGPAPLLAAPDLRVLVAATAGTALAGVLGSLGFAALRRAWLVEQPLPYPSFEQYLELLQIAEAPRVQGSLRRTGALLGLSGAAAGAWTFAQQFPLGGRTLLQPLEGSGWVGSAGLQQPLATAQWTWLNFALSPLLLAVGWFMRWRIALVVLAGSAFAWLLAVPLAVALGVPGFGAASGPAALAAFAGPVRAVAAGAMVGAGVTALVRLRRHIGPAVRGALALRGRDDGYESPPHHAGWAAAACLLGLPLVLALAGAPLGAAVLVAALVVVGVLLLGAVAVKVAGETSLEPASAAGFLMVLVLALALVPFGLPASQVALLALLGGAAFFAGITMMGNLLLDLKIALYVGNAPRAVMRAALLGIVPGALLGGVVAGALGQGLASGALDLPAPQARAFATLVTSALTSQIPLALIAFGAVLGAFAEWRTGLGTAFGLGMFLPIGIPAAFMAGSLGREAWERHAAARGLAGETLDRARSQTYLIATGLMVGEALVGTAAALVLAFGG